MYMKLIVLYMRRIETKVQGIEPTVPNCQRNYK